jgi:hypothetical protein
MAEKEKRKPRVLIWERVPPDEALRDKPVSKLFEPPEDRKGWDRASVTLNTHPLHRSPRFGPDDLRLPQDRPALRGRGAPHGDPRAVAEACP